MISVFSIWTLSSVRYRTVFAGLCKLLGSQRALVYCHCFFPSSFTWCISGFQIALSIYTVKCESEHLIGGWDGLKKTAIWRITSLTLYPVLARPYPHEESSQRLTVRTIGCLSTIAGCQSAHSLRYLSRRGRQGGVCYTAMILIQVSIDL